MIAELLEKAITMSREKEIHKFFRPILKRIPPFIFETKCAIWRVRFIHDHNSEIKPGISITVSLSDFNETLNWIRRLNRPDMLDEREKNLAISEGHYWVNVKYEGGIIGCAKFGVNKAFIYGYKKNITLPENVAYLTDLFVLPEFRGKRVAPYLVDQAFVFLKNKGFTKVLGFNEIWNIDAQKCSAKVAKQKTKKIRYLKIFGFGFFTFNPINLCLDF